MSNQIKRAGSKKNLRSRSIPVNNIYEINSLNDIPNKDLHYKVIKDIINDHINYLKTLNASELSSQINIDIDNYNNHINLIRDNDNKLLQDEHKLYGRLLTLLHADKIYLDNLVNENDNINYDNSELYEDENNFYDNVETEYSNLVEEVQNYYKIQSINDLLKFAGDYKPEITFYNNKDNYDTTTNNFKLESINQLIKIMKKVDKAIRKYNEFIEYFENGGKISTAQFNKVVDRVVGVSKLFKYYHFTEISKEQLYPVDLVFNSSYSEAFNKMLFEDFNVKYQKFKKENKNIKHNTFMFFKYYYLDDPEKSHNTPIKEDNYYSPEKILSGESMKEIISESDKTKGSDAEITNLEEPVANSILSFEFFNFYDKSHNEISDILKNMDIDYNESAGFKELNKFNSNVSKKRFNREGELFTYKINSKAIEEYFRSKLETQLKNKNILNDTYLESQIKINNYTKILIEYLNRLQIFEEFNAKRVEYNYNCLLYALYVWMKDNLSEDVAQKICLDLMCFNFSRFVTLKDISVINKYFKNNAKDFGKRYKIKIYRWNNVMNRLKTTSKSEANIDYHIPIALIESNNMNIDINHFIIYEDIDFMKIAKKIGLSETEFTKENNDEMLKLINNLKGDSKNNNWKTLNGYLLIKYLLNSEVKIKNKEGKDETIKFFTPLDNDEIDELIDEKDELNNKIKEKELYKMINEMSNYDLSILQERAFKRVKTIINSKFNKKDYKDINDFISGVIINDKKYKHLCFYDFEASTHEKDHHKAYMVCYAIINFPERILSEDDLIKFKEDFNKNYKIQTIYGENCAERFLKAIPDKTLCYAHNAKYDTSFFDYSNIDIVESCEKDGNMYSRDIIYNNKYITFKDSYKLISSKLKKFPEMFALGDIQKEVFPYNFYTIDNLNKYKNINFKLESEEFKSIEDELRQGFNKINDDKKNKAYNEFREIIKTKFNGIFNMRRYSKFYCERDVEILFKGLICMRTYLYKITALDCLKYLTISTIAHRHMINDVYSKTSFSSDSKTNQDKNKNNNNNNSQETITNNEYLEDLYNTTGVLNQYIQSSIWGGVCASYKNAKLLIKKVISDFDAVSLYTSAMKRINIITGKCRKFELNELDEINKSMNVYDSQGNVVGYNNKNCLLLKNTNKENEKDKDKINMYIVTIRIKDSKKKRDNPRIVVKNEIICGKIKKYPNLPVGNIMVNVDKNANLNNYKYKYDHVNECIVTIDNIMLEDYIEYHDIEFEVLAGVYWKDCCGNVPLIECFLKYSVLESKSQELIDKYDNILDAKFLIKPELKEAYYNLVEKYQNIRNGVVDIVQGKKSQRQASPGSVLDKLTNEEKNKIVNANKNIEKIKEEINDLDDILCNTRSSKHSKIQEVMQELFNARLKYKSEGNPLEGVIKLLLNSVYGKTIQKPTTKKINYVRVLVNNEIDLNEKPEHVRNYIIKEYNRFVDNYRLKLDDMYSNDEITKDEYDSKVNSIEKLVTINNDGIFKCYYSPLITFVENNKNKIVGMNKVNNNMYRIETIEQIEQHKSFNHVGVQILSMSKRIVNEVICTAQDLGFKVYYQDTDSIHIDYANIPKLSEEFKRKYNRELIGKGLGQFHSDFEPCKIKNGEKPDVTLALLTIINGKKNYIDVKFNPACYFENFDKDKDYNICLVKKYHEELDVLDIIKNYHIRNKGINKSGVVSTSEELDVSCPELYLKIFNNERIKFNLSKARPSFQFTKTLTVVNKELNRFVQTEGNRIVIEEDKEDIIIAENEKNRKNVKVEVDMSIRDHPVINIVGEIKNDYQK